MALLSHVRPSNQLGHRLRPVHFISDSPRSGSSLLEGLLRQKPCFHAGMSSPVGGLSNTLQGEMSRRNQYSVFITGSIEQLIRRTALKVAYYGEGRANPMLLQHETLADDSADALRGICELADDPVFAHDFDNASYDSDESGLRAGTPRRHTARKRISVLLPDGFRRFENDAFWRDPQLSFRGVRVV